MSSPSVNLPIKFAHQAYGKSCWACCTRLVMNCYLKADKYKTDDELAKALGLSVNELQDIRAVLEKTDMFDSLDDKDNIPSFDDIKKEIHKGCPLIICISGKPVKKGGDCIGGHYVLVIGYDDAAKKITVLDPARAKGNDALQSVPYDTKIYPAPYNNKLYWGVPYFTKAPKK